MVFFEDKDGDGEILDENETDNPLLLEVLQRSYYYPFGMGMEGTWSELQIDLEQDYLYNGKERDSDLDLNWDHYGFRMYDSSIGRFTGVDPISDQFAHVSIYNYAENEPIGHIDLWGLQKTKYRGAQGPPSPYDDDIDQTTNRSSNNSEKLEQAIDDYKSNRPNEQINNNENGSYNDSPVAEDYKVYRWGEDAVGNSDGALTLGGIGINDVKSERYGNTGTRFRSDVFGIPLKGNIGQKITIGIKYAGPIASIGSLTYSLTSNQSLSWKIADTGFTGVGVLGGVYGGLASLGYTFSAKPLIQKVYNPDKDLPAFHVKYCNKTNCSQK